ncbi:tryptophan synthase subunit alpha [Aequorivita sp. CIP111184]|uniref:tryptophan synthase subunit alpha n=1 Tax=Aequorivita sp. CIP111184 TaxID=2211356 RepID=UPI000DBC228D|nr:tryptophan synthase subunit alpha [Aequorivita sp. CIP111184]SRX54382.1 Tryptophan synthase alpha chain [Aequorivita sp. CIP111184]
MNRIKQKLSENKKLLSIYFTAGYPKLDDTVEILQQLEKSGVDMVEIGLPFSDPLADGPTIQASSQEALKNGMTTDLLFQQLKDVRKIVSIPLIIMGYFNPMLQFGVENFCKKCAEVSIDGLILPDLPLAEYEEHYAEIFKKHGLLNIFLITPQTSEERIRQIDNTSEGFIYMVSSASVTGSSDGFGKEQESYFERIASMKLNSPLIVGFGISDSKSFQQATKHTNGAIIGSAFIKMLSEKGFAGISSFIKSIR